jgi:uncharacterized protein (TIGR03382 family)
MSSTSRALLGAALALALAPLASASVLIGTMGHGGFSQRANPSSIPFDGALIAIGMDDANPNNGLFADIPHNATGIFQADASTYPTAFPIFAAKLTDGLVNDLYKFQGFNSPTQLLTGTSFGPEALQLGISPAVDFSGYTITHIRLIINTLSIGPGTINGGDSTAMSFSATYQFWGEPIPAPGASVLALLGAGVLARRRR